MSETRAKSESESKKIDYSVREQTTNRRRRRRRVLPRPFRQFCGFGGGGGFGTSKKYGGSVTRRMTEFANSVTTTHRSLSTTHTPRIKSNAASASADPF